MFISFYLCLPCGLPFSSPCLPVAYQPKISPKSADDKPSIT